MLTSNEHKEEIIARLLVLWKEHPHLRLCQLIVAGTSDEDGPKDIFYTSDWSLIAGIEAIKPESRLVHGSEAHDLE